MLGLFFIGSILQSQTSYSNENENTKILKEILKEIEQLKKGQDKLSKELATLKTDQPSQNKAAGGVKGGKKNVPIGNSVVLGNADAPITVIKWTDFQWPYCAKSVSLIDDILEKYPNDVKVVVKNFPLSFHKQARKAAKYALAANKQGKFKEMYDLIFANYRTLKTNEDLPLELAQNIGLDLYQLNLDMNSLELEYQIEKEYNQLKSLKNSYENNEYSGVRLAVPKFFINGREPEGRSLESFSKVIEEELKKHY